jgi:hypothetical protein
MPDITPQLYGHRRERFNLDERGLDAITPLISARKQ